MSRVVIRAPYIIPNLRCALFSVLLVGALLSWGCGPSATKGDGDSGTGNQNGTDAAVDAGDTTCENNDDCNGGYCVAGRCCPSEERVCGQVCCEVGEVCFANSCVRPGKDCHSAADCNVGEYCELGLGEGGGGGDASVGDGGAGSNDGGVCLHPAPPGGRCLELPRECEVTDAGVPVLDAGVCIPECEYYPDPDGPLNAEIKWHWGPSAVEYPDFVDVWATPTVGRMYDSNCDGRVDDLDPPNIIFVSGDAKTTCCSCGGYTPSTCLTGVLRVLDGLSGQEIWSLRRAETGSIGFAGLSVAIGDIYTDSSDNPDGGGRVEIAVVTGEGYVAVIEHTGEVMAVSDEPIPGHTHGTFGWGGGLALADMNGDGDVEIAYGPTVFSTSGGMVSLLFTGTGGRGGRGIQDALSTFVDLDGAADGHLELLAGRTAYKYDGTQLWHRSDLGDGFAGVGDFDGDGLPETVLVASGSVYILDGATGATELGPVVLPGSGFGGPPTVADFDGDGHAEIGVAQADFYSLLKPDYTNNQIQIVWEAPNHDLSSSVTGSTVFDFEGDGAAEVIYNDECFLWVYDGATGEIRFAAPTTSFTATEASLVADVDGDGHAEVVMISNGANPSAGGWGCDVAPWNQPDPNSVRPAWTAPAYGPAYRGITVFGDTANSWVGTRTLWNQHTYHVSNICDYRDDACDAPNEYGAIPRNERTNWTVPWLNNFRQNVQDQGLFNAPDATVSLVADCSEPVVLRGYVRNLGANILPAGVEVGFYLRAGGEDTLLGTETTSSSLFMGQMLELVHEVDPSFGVTLEDLFVAKIHTDPQNPTFHECREDNNESEPAEIYCID